MVKGVYHYLSQTWREGKFEIDLIKLRKEPSLILLKRPTRIDKARRLGYKAKPGIYIARVKLKRGGHKRPRPRSGRKPSRLHTRKNLRMNYRWIAEQRAARKTGLEVLNSYFLAKDGKYYWYEVILVDRENPAIKADKNLKWITSNKHKGRAFRGLTSAAKKARGLRVGKRAW
ncbi:MAG: 50S ribosomal protein L15e [Candidatus Pacearchaeota archaeon]